MRVVTLVLSGVVNDQPRPAPVVMRVPRAEIRMTRILLSFHRVRRAKTLPRLVPGEATPRRVSTAHRKAVQSATRDIGRQSTNITIYGKGCDW